MKYLSFFLVFCSTAYLFAQNTVPEAINYQTVICDTLGNPLTDQPVSIRITILDSSINGIEVYEEVWESQTTNQFGLITLAIGRGSAQPIGGQTPIFSEIGWSTDPKFIKVEVDPNNGFNWQDMGRADLLTVPYAMHAKTAKNSESAAVAQIAQFAEFAQVADSAIYAQTAEFAQIADTALHAVVAETAQTIISDAGVIRSEGGIGNGSDFEMLAISVDLSGKEGRWIHLYGATALSEVGNTSNTSILRIKLDNNVNDTTITAIRQGIGAYSNAPWDGNSTASISIQGYFQIPNEYATSNVTIMLNGGITSGNFYWGDQSVYSTFDGEKAGAYLGFVIF